ncbi:MAG: methionine synthase [Planctomycetes bacterium]|nr:methionine synthase [Planctomycetota bacterium]HJO26267.1 methionine synthase [Planctomycetota bacterium]
MTSSFRDTLAERVLIMDGAMGTSIHALNLDLERDFKNLENCCEVLNETSPTAISGIHEEFLEVGCDAVETNTFGATPLTLGEFGVADRARDWNLAAAHLAREACERYATDERPRFVVGSMGPGTRLPSLGHVGFDELRASYAVQARALAEGGVDAFAVETCQDPLQIKAALSAIRAARDEAGRDIATIVSVTMEVTGTMLVGTDMSAAIALLDPFDIDVLALNCATGPREMGEHIRSLAKSCRTAIGVYPNAGLPQLVDGLPSYPLTPEELGDWLRRFVREDGVSLVGGCCGTTPDHMREVVHMVSRAVPAIRQATHAPQVTSIYGAVPLRQDKSLLLVGERSNANGSQAFREHLLADDLDAMVQLGRDQLRDGSHLLDVCAAYVGRDEGSDLSAVVERYRTDVPAPLMIDSTNAAAIEAALKACGGRCVINSVNLEDGEARCAEILPLAREHGAAVVCLTIDEDGMAKTADEKVRIARRLFDLCVNDYGMRPEDLLFDVLTFTICTGNADDRRLGLETLEAIKLLGEELPGVATLLGLSNISFGLRPAARHVLNSVYMHHAQEAGLTAAILHPGRIEPLHRIDPQALRVAEDLIFDRRREGYDPLQEFMALFEGVEVRAKRDNASPADLWERLRWRIIEGERDGLADDLELAREEKPPLSIINEDLLAGMARVGELFGAGDMQLPFVLQSAETMKAAVRHLEPHMDGADQAARGKLVLATVRGDVHDIGKNLVDIILTNNGYTVFNVGIKQPIQHILEVAFEHAPDAIGMSGLLVKSTVIMKENLEEMNRRNIRVPVILGGAALTRSYVEEDLRAIYRGDVYYAKDAFDGLELMNTIASDPERASLLGSSSEDLADEVIEAAAGAPGIGNPTEVLRATLAAVNEMGPPPPRERRPAALTTERGAVPPTATTQAAKLPPAPFLGPRLIESIPLQSILPYINETTLFQFQWGYRRKGKPAEEYRSFIKEQVRPIYFELAKSCAHEGILRPRGAYGFWRAFREGEALVLLDPEDEGREVARFDFPRQKGKQHLCITDFFRADKDDLDTVALQAVTIGQEASDVAREWFGADRYQDYLHLHGLSVEAAEGVAEFVHSQIRSDWGISGEDARDMQDLLKQDYRGARFSFGYPACPNLESQEIILDLLGTERIDIHMGDESQLWPEQSTSAIVCHHPQARYFTL